MSDVGGDCFVVLSEAGLFLGRRGLGPGIGNGLGSSQSLPIRSPLARD